MSPPYLLVGAIASLFLAPAHAGASHAAAERLNARYAATPMACASGTPLHECSGVMIRITNTILMYPGQIERDAVSFSFIRRDIGIVRLFQDDQRAGLVMSMDPHHPGRPRVRCIYLQNAYTTFRETACGSYPTAEDPGGFTAPCRHQQIRTLADWEHYLKARPDPLLICAQQITPEEMKLAVQARQLLPQALRERWNEVVLGNWSSTALSQLPLEAVTVSSSPEHPPKDALLQQAHQLRADIQQRAGRDVPILRLNLGSGGSQPFSYHPEDQPLP